MCKPLQHHKRNQSQPPLTNLIKLNQINMSLSSSSSSSDNSIKKSVSFNSIHDVVHIVENYKLTLSTKEDHDRVWYSQMEMAQLARKEYFYKYGHLMKEESSSLSKQEEQLKAARQKIINRRLGAAAHGTLPYHNINNGGVRQSMAIARGNKARHMTSNKMNMSTHDALAASRRGRNPRHHNHSTNMARIVKNNPVAVQQQHQQNKKSLNNKKANVPATGRTSSPSPSRHRGWFSEMYHPHSHKKQLITTVPATVV
jgi:hypothetical protein